MDNNSKDRLAEIIGTTDFSKRIELFVWISLPQGDQYFVTQSLELMPGRYRDVFADHLNRNQRLANDIRNRLQGGLLPEHYLDWLVETKRQPLWVEEYISRPKITEPTSSRVNIFPSGIPHHLVGRNRSIAMFDYWASTTMHPNERIGRSNAMHLAWQDQTRQDRYFSWLDGEDGEKKMRFFENWLKSKPTIWSYFSLQFQSHEDLLIFFDQPKFSESDKRLLNADAKIMWNQQQRRAKANGKKQCNFVLSEKTIVKLEKLAQKYGLSRTEIVELIIDSEAKNERYIRELLHRKSLLTTPLV